MSGYHTSWLGLITSILYLDCTLIHYFSTYTSGFKMTSISSISSGSSGNGLAVVVVVAVAVVETD